MPIKQKSYLSWLVLYLLVHVSDTWITMFNVDYVGNRPEYEWFKKDLTLEEYNNYVPINYNVKEETLKTQK